MPCVEHFSCFDSHCRSGCCVSPVMLPFHLMGVSGPTKLEQLRREKKKLKYFLELSAGSYCISFANCDLEKTIFLRNLCSLCTALYSLK